MKRANYRAPRDHREALIVPSPAEWPAVVAANRALLETYSFAVLGAGIQELRRSAREQLLQVPYSCEYLDVPPRERQSPDSPLILTGHQPELYHPGVWLKNFLAGFLARAVGGRAVNLNVDNDAPHHTAIRVPVSDEGRTRVVEVPYLKPTGGLPFEELSGELLVEGVAETLRDQGVDGRLCDAVAEYWTGLCAARRHGTLVKTITCARHRLEHEAGLANLEALVSDVAQQTVFRLFVLDILANLARFHEAHNGGLAEFRRVHHEKNAAQPVPDLDRDGDRLEMPFWVWRTGEKRQKLWAEVAENRLRLFFDGETAAIMEVERSALNGGAAKGLALLATLESRGVRLRPRALTLTLFARVFLGDLFVHGLGGAVYDKVTDEIIRHYYGVEPPQFVLATGTAWLSLACYNVTPRDRAALVRRLRDMRHNPELLLGGDVRQRPDVASLLARKRDLVERRAESAAARSAAWHELREVNRKLAALFDGEPEATKRRLATVREQLAHNAVLHGREYPFVLYPRQELIDFYREAAGPLLELKP